MGRVGKSENKSVKNVDRRLFILEALKKTGQVVVATNASYIVTHMLNKTGNTAGAK